MGKIKIHCDNREILRVSTKEVAVGPNNRVLPDYPIVFVGWQGSGLHIHNSNARIPLTYRGILPRNRKNPIRPDVVQAIV